MRTRLLAGTVLLTMVALAALFVPAAIALAQAEGEAQLVELQREAADVAARADAGGADVADAPSGGETPVDAGSGPAVGAGGDDGALDEHQFAVYDRGGARAGGEGPDTLDAPLRAALDGRSASARVGEAEVVAVPLARGGALRAAEPSSEAEVATRDAVVRLGVSALLVLGAGAIAAWLLAWRLTRPLAQLRGAASRLGAGDFTATAPTTGVVEIDDVAKALNSSARRIGSLVERERRLTVDTTHQMRTPIVGLRLAIEAELADPRPDPADVLHEALGAIDRLEATVGELSDLARDMTREEPFDVGAVLASAADRWAPILARAGRSLEAERTTATVRARRVAVETIIDVLVDNALRHGEGAVRIRARSVAGAVHLSVEDAGTCDLSDEQLFARHESTAGSTGIGLHLARTLASAEGARMRLASGSPTTFELVIPFRGSPADGGE